jgi:3',5'-cyclic AMP phosphodiesterase CpdA
MPETNESTPIQYLFRFRDLIAPTIAEHQKVIEQSKACWWGWWKRPSEGTREEVWDPLASEASESKPVRVGLFDSGSELVYAAWVTRVIKPVPPKDTSPELPHGEAILVPEYYRRSPFSRAWMRLKYIEQNPLGFFGNYSFAAVPRLRYYSEKVLSRMQDKVIISPDELRGMDTTIWKVRPRRNEDSDREIILTIHSLSEPVSTESVDLHANTILHLTDPHYAIGKSREQHVWRLEGETTAGQSKPTLAEAIKGAIDKRPVGMVLVTGDLTITGDKQEFEEARISLFRLLGLLELDTDRLVVIPGNHDIRWTKSETYSEDTPVSEAPAEAKANYEQFYLNLFRHKANPTLSMGRRFLTPSGIALEICAVNSSSLAQGKNFLAGMGRIEESAFGHVANLLNWKLPGMSLKILALHHHLMLTENLEPAAEYSRGFGIAIDATRITRMAARNGVHLVIHGHKHRAFLWRSGVYELPEHAQQEYQLGDLSIIGGGSAGSKSTEAENNYFNLVEVLTSGLNVEMYRATSGGVFQQMSTWTAGLSLAGVPPNIVLSPWSKK